MKGKPIVPLRKDKSFLLATNRRSCRLPNPITELVKVWWQRRVPSPRGPCVVFLRTRSMLSRWWSPSSRTQTWILVLNRWWKSWGRRVYFSLKTQIRPSWPKVPSSHRLSQPLATTIDENQTVYTMDESKVWSYERLLLNQTDLEASIKNRRSPRVNGPRRFS